MLRCKMEKKDAKMEKRYKNMGERNTLGQNIRKLDKTQNRGKKYSGTDGSYSIPTTIGSQ